jgi:hypothetical protein
VHVTSIDLEADQAHGQVVVEDGVVRLRDVQGQAAGGEIRTSGDLDFRPTPSQLRFAVEVSRVQLARLPKSWSLPSQLRGRLTGEADLRVTTQNGKAQTHGQGQGVIHEARIAGLSTNPIHLVLHADGSRFRFSRPPPAAAGAEKQPGSLPFVQ